MSSIIEQLIQCRKELHLSQEDVVRRMKTVQSTVTRIECRARFLKLETIKRVADAVGYHIVLD